MSANLENSPVTTGMEKVSFHSNLQKEQCQRLFKISYKIPYSFHMPTRLYSFKLGFSSM